MSKLTDTFLNTCECHCWFHFELVCLRFCCTCVFLWF